MTSPGQQVFVAIMGSIGIIALIVIFAYFVWAARQHYKNRTLPEQIADHVCSLETIHQLDVSHAFGLKCFPLGVIMCTARKIDPNHPQAIVHVHGLLVLGQALRIGTGGVHRDSHYFCERDAIEAVINKIDDPLYPELFKGLVSSNWFSWDDRWWNNIARHLLLHPENIYSVRPYLWKMRENPQAWKALTYGLHQMDEQNALHVMFGPDAPPEDPERVILDPLEPEEELEQVS